MDSNATHMLLSQQELAKRWGRTEAAIGLASAVGVGPRYIKVDGAIKYPVEDIQRYERACLFFEPADVAYQTLA
jgi:3,4-dihydroxy-2-butanone 4-phosphate synthase